MFEKRDVTLRLNIIIDCCCISDNFCVHCHWTMSKFKEKIIQTNTIRHEAHYA